MESKSATAYTVACCTPGCAWQEDCATRVEARFAGEQHEQEHDGHITYVFPPNSAQKVA
jgi:hypothetical protein